MASSSDDEGSALQRFATAKSFEERQWTDYTVLKGPDGYGLKLGDTGLVTSSTKAAAEAGVPVGVNIVAVDGVAVKGKVEILAAVRGSTAEGGVVLSVAPGPPGPPGLAEPPPAGAAGASPAEGETARQLFSASSDAPRAAAPAPSEGEKSTGAAAEPVPASAQAGGGRWGSSLRSVRDGRNHANAVSPA